MNYIKKTLCYIKAIPLYIKCGVWSPHIYKEETREQAIIISTENSFRVSKSFIHNDEEIVHPNATLIKNKCIYCGKENFSWFDREPFTYN